MGIIDRRTSPTELEAAETDLRTAARRAVIHARRFLDTAVAQVNRYGKAALSAQMGDDAAEFADLYTDARQIVQTFTAAAVPALADLPAEPVELEEDPA